ncbi:MAG: hypothetical protein K0U98_13900 [Deltaproteobacteria bacterium]|nr:hypothetical protein [Deltaproteobacteria bacterium]
MRPCIRFEKEALEVWQRGEPLPPHFDSCPDCLEALASYERLGKRIGETGADLRPDPQWQGRVWSRIARQENSGSKTSVQAKSWFGGWWRYAASLGIAIVALLAIWLPIRGPQAPSLEISVDARSGTPRRGLVEQEARIGDRLTLEGRTAEHDFVEIRLYRYDSQLVFQCSGEPSCRQKGANLIAIVPLSATGRYQSLLLLSDTPLPPTVGNFDADAAAALESGIHLIRGKEIEVR